MNRGEISSIVHTYSLMGSIDNDSAKQLFEHIKEFSGIDLPHTVDGGIISISLSNLFTDLPEVRSIIDDGEERYVNEVEEFEVWQDEFQTSLGKYLNDNSVEIISKEILEDVGSLDKTIEFFSEDGEIDVNRLRESISELIEENAFCDDLLLHYLQRFPSSSR